MEPYVLVKHTPSAPMFDARFSDYGYNKVSYVETLRMMNFKFYIFNQIFALDYPHPG